MAIAQSKITAHGQISVPTAVRRKLGVGPGSVIAWAADGEQIVVRLAAVYERTPSDLAVAVDMLLNHQHLTVQVGEVVGAALEHFRRRPSVEFAAGFAQDGNRRTSPRDVILTLAGR